MIILTLAVLSLCYWLGWLPASFVVPFMLAFSALVSLPRGRARPRPGYIRPPSSASAGASPGMVERVATYTSSPTTPGAPLAARGIPIPPAAPSRIGAPIASGLHAAASHGAPTMDADPPAWYMQAYEERRRPTIEPPPRPHGDCGCNDAA